MDIYDCVGIDASVIEEAANNPERFISLAKEVAQDIFQGEPKENSFWILLHSNSIETLEPMPAHGLTLFRHDPFEGDSHKNYIARAMRETGRILNVQASCFLSEAWALESQDPDKRKEHYDYMQTGGHPVDHPDRQEVVFALIEHKNFKGIRGYISSIINTDDGVRRLSDFRTAGGEDKQGNSEAMLCSRFEGVVQYQE